MQQPTLTESLDAARKHLEAALTCLADARNAELAAARAITLEASEYYDKHARHLLANRALIAAEKCTMEALEILP